MKKLKNPELAPKLNESDLTTNGTGGHKLHFWWRGGERMEKDEAREQRKDSGRIWKEDQPSKRVLAWVVLERSPLALITSRETLLWKHFPLEVDHEKLADWETWRERSWNVSLNWRSFYFYILIIISGIRKKATRAPHFYSLFSPSLSFVLHFLSTKFSLDFPSIFNHSQHCEQCPNKYYSVLFLHRSHSSSLSFRKIFSRKRGKEESK